MQQLTQDIQNSLKQDFAECLNDLEDEVNMDQFYINLQELKDEAIQDEAVFNKVRKKNLKSKENCFMQSTQKKVLRNFTPQQQQSKEKLVYKISTPKDNKIKLEQDMLNKKLQRVNNRLQKQMNKPLQKDKKSKSKNFDQFYQRSLKYMSRSQEKVKQMQEEQKLQNTKDLTFNPKTNNSQKKHKKTCSISFIQKIEQKEQQKKMKIQQQRIDLKQQKEKEIQQECSFKPKLKINTKIKRSLSNLFEWKKQQDIKKMQLQEQYTINAKKSKEQQNLNQTKKNVQNEKKDTSNGGQRLYQQFVNKKQQQKDEQAKKISERLIKKPSVKKKSYSKSFKVINLDPQQPNYLQKNKQLISTMKRKKSTKSREKSEPKKKKLNYNQFRDLQNFFDQLKFINNLIQALSFNCTYNLYLKNNQRLINHIFKLHVNVTDFLFMFFIEQQIIIQTIFKYNQRKGSNTSSLKIIKDEIKLIQIVISFLIDSNLMFLKFMYFKLIQQILLINLNQSRYFYNMYQPFELDPVIFQHKQINDIYNYIDITNQSLNTFQLQFEQLRQMFDTLIKNSNGINNQQTQCNNKKKKIRQPQNQKTQTKESNFSGQNNSILLQKQKPKNMYQIKNIIFIKQKKRKIFHQKNIILNKKENISNLNIEQHNPKYKQLENKNCFDFFQAKNIIFNARQKREIDAQNNYQYIQKSRQIIQKKFPIIYNFSIIQQTKDVNKVQQKINTENYENDFSEAMKTQILNFSEIERIFDSLFENQDQVLFAKFIKRMIDKINNQNNNICCLEAELQNIDKQIKPDKIDENENQNHIEQKQNDIEQKQDDIKGKQDCIKEKQNDIEKKQKNIIQNENLQDQKNQLRSRLETLYNQQNFQQLNDEIKNCDYSILSFIDINKKYEDGNTLLEKCILQFKYSNLKKYCEKILQDQYDPSLFFEYCKKGNLQNINMCIMKSKVDIEEQDQNYPFHNTGFLYACIFGHKKIVKYLHEQFQQNINQRNSLQQTGLMLASFHNQIEIVQYLIEKQAKINEIDIGGQTSLIFACKAQNLEIVKFLLQNKADFNIVDQKGLKAYSYLTGPSKNLLRQQGFVNQIGFIDQTQLIQIIIINIYLL